MSDTLPATIIDIPPATSVKDVHRTAMPAPLRAGDSRYAKLDEGNRVRGLRKIVQVLTRHAEGGGEDGFAKIVFSGHRGCGKTTELYRIEKELSDRYYAVHLNLDDNLRDDFDYSLMLLALCEGLVDKFADEGMPLDPALAENVALWFAERTEYEVEKEEIGASLTVDAKAKAKFSLAGFGLELLARLRAQAVGSVARRREIKQKLQLSPQHLLERVNVLINEAEGVLASKGRPARLLIVQDSLDRLGKDAARGLLFDTGDLLKQVRADCIFTAPIALSLAPYNLRKVFETCITLPMVKVRLPDGAEHPHGIEVMRRLVARRVELTVFDDEATVNHLCAMSGGSVRDLVHLLADAADNAAIDDKPVIDRAAVDEAVKTMRIEYERLLIPARVYYPRLAEIHRTKADGYRGASDLDGDKAEQQREHFGALLLNGAVMEYNGEESWYDVHPVVQAIKAFQNAIRSAADAATTGG